MSFAPAKLAAFFALALAVAGCSNKLNDLALAGASNTSPGSPQDFVVNVGDRVFFEYDFSELTPQSIATLEKQAKWLQAYSQYTFTVEGHADERGTREYNIALGARRAQTVATTRLAWRSSAAHAYDLLRQGATGRGL